LQGLIDPHPVQEFGRAIGQDIQPVVKVGFQGTAAF
jgi:hypothetical protein